MFKIQKINENNALITFNSKKLNEKTEGKIYKEFVKYLKRNLKMYSKNDDFINDFIIFSHELLMINKGYTCVTNQFLKINEGKIKEFLPYKVDFKNIREEQKDYTNVIAILIKNIDLEEIEEGTRKYVYYSGAKNCMQHIQIQKTDGKYNINILFRSQSMKMIATDFIQFLYPILEKLKYNDEEIGNVVIFVNNLHY